MLTAITLFLFLFPHFVQQSNTYIINGSFNKPQSEEWIYLVRFMDPDPKVDSTRIVDGKFTFRGEVSFPEVYGLSYHPDRAKGIAPIFLEPGDLKIVIDLDDWTFKSKVTGGKINQNYNDFAADVKEKFSDKITELNKKKPTANENRQKEIDGQIRSLMEADRQYRMDYVKAHPGSPESIFIFSWIFGSLDNEELGDMLSKFPPEIQNTIIYKNISGMYEMHMHPAKPEALIYDNEIKDMNINFDEDPVIKTLLQQNPGKTLYIDFWAPWCGPCLKAFPFSGALRKRLKPEPIAFIYICLNADIKVKEEKWKEAIIREQLKGQNYLWPEMLINKFFKEANSSIQGIPRYVIIDKEGKVVNANAPGPGSDQTAAMLIRASE